MYRGNFYFFEKPFPRHLRKRRKREFKAQNNLSFNRRYAIIRKIQTVRRTAGEREMDSMQDDLMNDITTEVPDEASGIPNPKPAAPPRQRSDTFRESQRPADRAARPRFKPETQTVPPRSRRQRPIDRILPFLLPAILLLVGLGAGTGIGYRIWGYEAPYTVDLKAIKAPEWIEQKLIRKNIFSRPDVSMREVKNIVIHYVGNPGTSADSNRRYFDSLADQDPEQGGASSSSHFIVGLEGEVIQCIPISEISYANAPRNFDTVTIEVCHPDETGKFTDASYDSLVKLTAWLCGELDLDEKDVIRHYDVNGKGCPRYFVDHEDAWKQFRKDVKTALKDQ